MTQFREGHADGSVHDDRRESALHPRRSATVEAVFGNLRNHKGLDRVTLGSQGMIDTQWKLCGLAHNIEKLATGTGDERDAQCPYRLVQVMHPARNARRTMFGI